LNSMNCIEVAPEFYRYLPQYSWAWILCRLPYQNQAPITTEQKLVN
jgi:hypothetical protein